MKFSKMHEWVNVEGQEAIVGISDLARRELGDIVYVELPAIGSKITAGDEVVVLESTKAAVDIYSPVSGEIVAVNLRLKENPDIINTSAESEGWLFKIRLQNPQELASLLTPEDYLAFIKPA